MRAIGCLRQNFQSWQEDTKPSAERLEEVERPLLRYGIVPESHSTAEATGTGKGMNSRNKEDRLSCASGTDKRGNSRTSPQSAHRCSWLMMAGVDTRCTSSPKRAPMRMNLRELNRRLQTQFHLYFHLIVSL
jgi:hypothetical protein